MGFEKRQRSFFGQGGRLSFPGAAMIAIETVMGRIGKNLRSRVRGFEDTY
jgi:hypothetical protein